MAYDEQLSRRIQDCGEIYLKHGGKRHVQIEKEMRSLGYSDFHRRVLYRRFEYGTCQPGWIETYGWDGLLKEKAYREELERFAAAQKSSPPYQGGNAAASADGVVFSYANRTYHETKNGPTAIVQPVLTNRVPLVNDFQEFTNWLKRVSPEKQWEFKHQVYIYKQLKRMTTGEIKRLMIFMPPRHGKSEMVTVRYAAWRLKQNPAMNIIIASYNQDLANRFSRKIKNVLCDDHEQEMQNAECEMRNDEATGGNASLNERAQTERSSRNENDTQTPAIPHSALRIPRSNVSPFPFAKARPKNTEAEWETTMGGGLRAVGVGSGVTGFGADLIIIDDPVKSRAEAESKTCRDRLYNWFNDDIRTRLEPEGGIVLIQTRWHEDDLAGRLLREAQEEGGEQWTVVNLPALAEEMRNAECGVRNEEELGKEDKTLTGKTHATPPHNSHNTIPHSALRILHLNDPLDRAPGTALWPERFPVPLLNKLKNQMGSYSFASLYQQRPTPAEGGMFKRKWFKIVNTPPPNLRWSRGYDLGISKNATADYTASMRIAFDGDNNMYIDGGYRARIEYPEQRRYILGRLNAERDTIHGIELSANGNAVIQDLRKSRLTQGRPLKGIRAQGDKLTHALPWIALAEEGRVFLVRGPWNAEFIEEAAAFPLGTHDDQIDAVSLAVRLHRDRGGRSFGFQ